MLWGLVLCGLAACQPFVEPPGAERTAPQMFANAYRANDGTMLPLRTWEPEGAPRAVVLGLHGFGDYANAFEAVGKQFAAAGIRTVAYDQRGFGKAPGRGRWHGVGRMAQDAADAVALLAKRDAPAPVYVLGLSMGGAIGMTMAARHPEAPVAGLAFVAPAVWGRQSMPWAQRQGLWLSAHAIPWYPVSGQGLQIQPSDNLEMLYRYARDPLVMKQFRVDLVWGLVDAMDAAVNAANHLRQPTLFLYGLRDELVPLGPTQRALLMVPPTRRRVAVYPNGYHMLLRDRNGGAVVNDLSTWLLDPSAPLPSGADQGGIETLLAADPR
jgi:acylglycerol lipase